MSSFSFISRPIRLIYVNHYTDFYVKVKHFFQLFYISFAYKIRALEENDINDSAYDNHVRAD